MNKLTKSLVAAGLLAGMSAPVLADGLSGNVALVSDYVWRGVEQSPGAAPTMQGGMDYETGAFSFGTWGSSLAEGGTEIDLYGAYSFGPVSVGAIYYYFPTGSLGNSGSTEVNVSGDAGPVSLMASYATDVSGNPYYLEASYSHGFGKVSLDLHAGYGETYTTSSGGAAFDYSIGVSGSAGGLDLAAVYAYSESTKEGKPYVSIGKSI
ncbi:MAG: TorF family putative porin [Acidiferrobacteraceae bacterium]|jgi:uncharacterized protein (TIGR02001 family)